MATYTDGLTAADTDSKEEIFRQLQIAKERLDTTSKGPSKGVTVIPKEKKLPKYAGKGDITEWLEDCETTLARFTNEKDKASFLLDHLEGAAKTEVKFQVDIRKATADEMITVLREVYGNHDTWIQLQQQFYSRDQKPGEDFMQYTYSLMDILLELRDKLPEGVKDMDSLLKQRVAEGVVDVTLKRELHRLNEERDKMKFHKFREHAKEWLDSGKKGKKTAIQEEHTTSNELQELEIWFMNRKRGWMNFNAICTNNRPILNKNLIRNHLPAIIVGVQIILKELVLSFRRTKAHLVEVNLLTMVEVEVHLNFRVGVEAKEAFIEGIPEEEVDLEEEEEVM